MDSTPWARDTDLLQPCGASVCCALVASGNGPYGCVQIYCRVQEVTHRRASKTEISAPTIFWCEDRQQTFISFLEFAAGMKDRADDHERWSGRYVSGLLKGKAGFERSNVSLLVKRASGVFDGLAFCFAVSDGVRVNRSNVSSSRVLFIGAASWMSRLLHFPA